MNLDSLQNLDPKSIRAILDLLYDLASEIENRFYPALRIPPAEPPSDKPTSKPPDRYPACPPSDSIPF